MDASCWGAISSTLIIPFRKPLNSNHISLDTFWYPGPPPIFPHHYCFRLQCHNFPNLPLSRISTSFTFLIIKICFSWSFFLNVTVSIYTEREGVGPSLGLKIKWQIISNLWENDLGIDRWKKAKFMAVS